MELCTHLVTGLPNRSVEVDRALQDLAQQDEHTSALAAALQAFLKRYGHRSFYLDIYHPTFADEPAQVLDLVQRCRSQAARPWEEQQSRRQEAARELHQALGHGVWGWLKRGIFDHVTYLAQRYVPLREDQRFYWQKTLAQMRRLCLLLGRRMAQSGVLEEEAHIFFLTQAEIEAYVQESMPEDLSRQTLPTPPILQRTQDAVARTRGAVVSSVPLGTLETVAEAQGGVPERGMEHGYAQRAASRQRQFDRLCQDSQIAPERAYPPFLRGNEPWRAEGDEDASRFRGRGISPGLAEGRVVIVHSPADFEKIQCGDVLIAEGVDPGWTPVFGLLSALVLERGGQLSHAAVVAREYGLPAVAGIMGITTSLRDGDLVLVDGLHGWVSKVA
jgi:rifampicin phosphotransferase